MKDMTRTRPARVFRASGSAPALLVALFAAGMIFPAPGRAPVAAEPDLDAALSAPAADLAQSYLSSKAMLENVLPMMDMGVAATIHAGGETITPRNASRFRKRYEKRLDIYETAMNERGAASFAGTYRTDATESCARSGSFWMGLIRENDAATVEIRQDGSDATLIVGFEYDGKTQNMENSAAIVENAIVIGDQMNSDYYSVGQLTDGTVTIRPDLRVLEGWPDWAAPPKQKDLLGCTVTLLRED